MENRIQSALQKHFESDRVVIWYDTKKELRDTFQTLELDGVEKVEILNNEYALKYRVLREQPEQKFLLYHYGPPPKDLENWLLDIQLAFPNFRTDQVSIWLADLGLGLEYAEVIEQHAAFFSAKTRLDALRAGITRKESFKSLRLKMLAAATQSETRLESILCRLLQDLADGKTEKMHLLKRCALDEFLWAQLADAYGYAPQKRSLRDFAIEIFKSSYAGEVNETATLNPSATVFLKEWMDSRQYSAGFETLSSSTAELLNIEDDLKRRSLQDIVSIDYFEVIDRQIIRLLVEQVLERTITAQKVRDYIRNRRTTHWYADYQDLYDALRYAADFQHEFANTLLDTIDLHDAVQRYAQQWYRLDFLYRKFTYHARKSAQASLMTGLREQIENIYSNQFLLPLNDRFSELIEASERWQASPLTRQDSFFTRWVKPFIDRTHKVCVIISDAMRYEIGHELHSLVRQEDRFEAKLEPALTLLPSYTQLGMAALLPHQELGFDADGESSTIRVDGQSSLGMVNREKILNKVLNLRAAARPATDIMQMHSHDLRAMWAEHDIMYVYHDRIDAIGDKRDTEDQVFEAAENTLVDLVQLMKKLANANVYNMLITADHGFIYQDRVLDESDFSGVVDGDKGVFVKSRRFRLGRDLEATRGLHTFRARDLGLAGDVDIQVPMSINRFRVRGAGSRFVHGGAALQEVVIPVLHVNKSRESDVKQVDVRIQTGGTNRITTGQIAVTFYQTAPVTDKVQPRTLRVGLYTQDGVLISSQVELIFDHTSENARDREQHVVLMLTREADDLRKEEVTLRLEEPVENTNQHRLYATHKYLLHRAFTSDFDF